VNPLRHGGQVTPGNDLVKGLAAQVAHYCDRRKLDRLGCPCIPTRRIGACAFLSHACPCVRCWQERLAAVAPASRSAPLGHAQFVARQVDLAGSYWRGQPGPIARSAERGHVFASAPRQHPKRSSWGPSAPLSRHSNWYAMTRWAETQALPPAARARPAPRIVLLTLVGSFT
jgi:hypothetical protein